VKKLKKALVELSQMNTTNREKGQANKKACRVLRTPQQKGDSVSVPPVVKLDLVLRASSRYFTSS